VLSECERRKRQPHASNTTREVTTRTKNAKQPPKTLYSPEKSPTTRQPFCPTKKNPKTRKKIEQRRNERRIAPKRIERNAAPLGPTEKNLKTQETRPNSGQESECNTAAARYNKDESENGGSTNEERRKNSK
jgi:hypothetical protein